jgi:hypothetical protein
LQQAPDQGAGGNTQFKPAAKQQQYLQRISSIAGDGSSGEGGTTGSLGPSKHGSGAVQVSGLLCV